MSSTFGEAIDEAASGDAGFCVTLEASNDADRWVQLTWDSLNFAYPFTAEPLQTLAERGIELPAMVELTGWEAGKFATFEHGAEPIGDFVSFIEAYLKQILGIEPNHEHLRVIRESL